MFGCSSARKALTEERLAEAVRVDMEERLDAQTDNSHPYRLAIYDLAPAM